LSGKKYIKAPNKVIATTSIPIVIYALLLRMYLALLRYTVKPRIITSITTSAGTKLSTLEELAGVLIIMGG
jgi:hypothetical protein